METKPTDKQLFAYAIVKALEAYDETKAAWNRQLTIEKVAAVVASARSFSSEYHNSDDVVNVMNIAFRHIHNNCDLDDDITTDPIFFGVSEVGRASMIDAIVSRDAVCIPKTDENSIVYTDPDWAIAATAGWQRVLIAPVELNLEIVREIDKIDPMTSSEIHELREKLARGIRTSGRWIIWIGDKNPNHSRFAREIAGSAPWTVFEG